MAIFVQEIKFKFNQNWRLIDYITDFNILNQIKLRILSYKIAITILQKLGIIYIYQMKNYHNNSL